MNRAIATQANLSALKFALNETAENLVYHANQSLSPAHGLNIINGYTDSDGNNRTVWQDSNGDSLSDANTFLRFHVNGQVYFAPARQTALAGQPAKGEIGVDEDSAIVPGDSVWITDYATQQAAQAAVINELLLAHTRESHADVHGGMTVLPTPMYDSAGHMIGNYTLQIVVAGIQYRIPCDTRLGGPLQAARATLNTTYQLTTGSGIKPDHRANPLPDLLVTVSGGTLPITTRWYGAQTATAYAYQELTGTDGNILEYYYVKQGTLGLKRTFSAPGRYLTRVDVTNASGTLSLFCTDDIQANPD